MKKGELIIPYIQAVVTPLAPKPKASLAEKDDVLTVILFWRIIGKILKGTGYWGNGAVRVWTEPHAMATVANLLDTFVSRIRDLRNEFIEGGKGNWEKHFGDCESALQNFVVEFRRSLRHASQAKDDAFRKELVARF